jgi:tyrosinase
MGPNGRASDGKVMDGPFAYDKRSDKSKWVLNVRDEGEPLYLRRQFGPNPVANTSLPTPANVKAALNATPYDVANYSPGSQSGFRNMAEGNIPPPGGLMHIRVHEWVGGNMSSAFISPNDPVFWLHHCYMDKL